MDCNLKELKGVSDCGTKLSEVDQIIFFDGVQEFASIQAIKTFLDAGVGIYPTNDELETYVPEQGEPNMFEFQSGRSQYIKSGVFSYSFFDKTASEYTFSAYESLNKRQVSYILIDKEGNVLVAVDGSVIKSIPMAKSTMKPQFVYSNGSDTVQGVTFTFNRGNVKPENIKIISAEQLGFNILGEYLPKVQANVEFTDVTTTGATVFLWGENEGVPVENGIAGILSGDVTIEANGGALAITSFDPSGDGDGFYDLVFATQSSGTEIQITNIAVTGYNFSTVYSKSFRIG